jgi:hypothetical protein
MRPAAIFAFVTLAASAAHAGTGYNGVQMNGVQMNGVQMNGVQMNGVQMNGVQMNGVQMNGVNVSGLVLNGSWLQGTIVDANSTCSHSQKEIGAPLNGCAPCAQVVANSDPHCATSTWDQACVSEATNWCAFGADKLVGATFTADTSGGARTLRLDSYQLAPDPAPVWKRTPGGGWIDVNADVYYYSFSYWKPTIIHLGPSEARTAAATPTFLRGTWNPICPEYDKDTPTAHWNTAIAVAGHWENGGKASNDGFTLACNDVGAIAKCVQRFQYKPWRYVFEATPLGDRSHYQTLEPFHEACVRMVRGDYCGDGVAHTVDGTEIDVYDYPGVQTKPPLLPSSFQFEAGWTPHGAACISVTRYQTWGGSMTPPPAGTNQFPDAIQQCTWLSPVQFGPNGQIEIIDGCGNSWNDAPNANLTLPLGNSDWPRVSYYMHDDSQQP